MDTEQLPIHRVTIDQIIAINIRYLRKAAGMTQEDLGELVGWTAANISAAERSADDSRDRRRFDGQTAFTFARALGVPLLALYLPPADEGTDRHYLVNTGDGDCGEWLDMGNLMQAVYPDNDDDTPVMARYRTWLTHAVERLMDPSWAPALARWLGNREPKEIMASRLNRIRGAQYVLADALGEVRDIADAFEAELKEGEEP